MDGSPSIEPDRDGAFQIATIGPNPPIAWRASEGWLTALKRILRIDAVAIARTEHRAVRPTTVPEAVILTRVSARPDRRHDAIPETTSRAG